jgi:hypothetical protein
VIVSLVFIMLFIGNIIIVSATILCFINGFLPVLSCFCAISSSFEWITSRPLGLGSLAAFLGSVGAWVASCLGYGCDFSLVFNCGGCVYGVCRFCGGGLVF